MDLVNQLLKELGVSKVKLAKYLGVSRQMVYNYLEMDSLDEWPRDKKTKLLVLFGVENENEIKNVTADNDTILRIDNMLSDTDSKFNIYRDEYNVKNLNRKNQALFQDIVSILKERLSEDKDAYNTFKYLFYFLQLMDDIPELKYTLAYFSKANNKVPVNEFAFNEEQQTMFEGITFQAISLFNGQSFSKSKVLETHKKFEQMIAQKNEEKLSRTQELYTVKAQALKELGYTEINEKNVTEVFEKIAEIQSRAN